MVPYSIEPAGSDAECRLARWLPRTRCQPRETATDLGLSRANLLRLLRIDCVETVHGSRADDGEDGNVDERDAVARLQRGDIGGLETLVRLYQVRAVRVAYLITRDAALADDIMQTAFLRAYERIGQFDATRSFGPWFLRGVVNDAVKATARGARQVSLDGFGRDGTGPPGAALADEQPGPEAL